MRINSKIPKTFSMYAKKNGKSGYIRFISHQTKSSDIIYVLTFVDSTRECSKFINFDKAKKHAKDYLEKYAFDELRIIDDKLNKVYYVKKEGKKAKL